jgi:hypothetical protein
MKQSLPSELNKIDTIEAIDGLILVTTKNGKTVRMTTRDAVKRAIAINEMPMNTKEENRVKLLLVDQIMTKVREANKQKESPDSARQALFINVMSGKDEKGKPVMETMDGRLRYLCVKYPTVSEKEILTVLEQPNITPLMVDQILGAIHRSNSAIYMPGGAIHNQVMDPNFKPQKIGSGVTV